MSFEGHTPGPWVAGREDMATSIEGTLGKYIYAGDKYIAASGFDVQPWPEVMANARLIAAAPELLKQRDVLLEACQSAATRFRRYEQMHAAKGTEEGNRKAQENAAAAAELEAAIALCKEGKCKR